MVKKVTSLQRNEKSGHSINASEEGKPTTRAENSIQTTEGGDASADALLQVLVVTSYNNNKSYNGSNLT